MSTCILCPEAHRVRVDAVKLGSVVFCPQCFTPFHAQNPIEFTVYARPTKGKARPSRDDDDDDDDDEEDEKPPKKTKAGGAKKKQDEEDEKPRGKKAARKKDDEDEDEEDEDEDDEEEEEEEEEEEPIQWTKTKRQVNVADKGLAVIVSGWYMILAFTWLAAICVDIHQLKDALGDWRSQAWFLFQWIALPLGYLALAVLLIGLVISLGGPPKLEGKGVIMAALLMGVLVFVLGVVMLLTQMGVFSIGADPVRYRNMMQLLVIIAVLCFTLTMVCLMGYLAKLLVFMRMNMESTQPTFSAAFIMLSLIAMVAATALR